MACVGECVCVFECASRCVDVWVHVCGSGKGVCLCVLLHVCVYELASMCVHTRVCSAPPQASFITSSVGVMLGVNKI